MIYTFDRFMIWQILSVVTTCSFSSFWSHAKKKGHLAVGAESVRSKFQRVALEPDFAELSTKRTWGRTKFCRGAVEFSSTRTMTSRPRGQEQNIWRRHRGPKRLRKNCILDIENDRNLQCVAVRLHEEIDASRFTWNEQCFACAPCISLI